VENNKLSNCFRMRRVSRSIQVCHYSIGGYCNHINCDKCPVGDLLATKNTG